MAFKLPSLKNVVIGFISAFFGVQIISLILSTIFPSIPVLKGGPAIFLLLLAVAVISLFVLGYNIETLDKKKTLVFVVIVFALLLLAFWKLPTVFPQLFSISPDFSDTIKSTMGSILGG